MSFTAVASVGNNRLNTGRFKPHILLPRRMVSAAQKSSVQRLICVRLLMPPNTHPLKFSGSVTVTEVDRIETAQDVLWLVTAAVRLHLMVKRDRPRDTCLLSFSQRFTIGGLLKNSGETALSTRHWQTALYLFPRWDGGQRYRLQLLCHLEPEGRSPSSARDRNTPGKRSYDATDGRDHHGIDRYHRVDQQFHQFR